MTEIVPKDTANYHEAVLALSQLDFETADLDGDLSPIVDTAIALVAKIFHRGYPTVFEDLEEQRALEQGEIDDDNELQFGP